MLGDTVGKVGRDTVQTMLPTLHEMYAPNFVIVNGENAAAGLGITPDIARGMLSNGVDVVTLGNHAWSRRDIMHFLEEEPRVLRPANYPAGSPGKGSGVFCCRGGGHVGVANLLGRTFMEPVDNPFRTADAVLETFRGKTLVSFFDFHAEATSEKTAFGYYLDGRASVVVGTHTHVQTADERILPKGTAYLTDVGMTGPHDSVIGVEIDAALGRFLTGMPARFETATGNPRLNAVLVEADEQTGKATDIERLSYSLDELLNLPSA